MNDKSYWYPYVNSIGEKYEVEVIPMIEFLQHQTNNEYWQIHALDLKSVFNKLLFLDGIFTIFENIEKFDSFKSREGFKKP